MWIQIEKSKRLAISKDIPWELMDKEVERKILCYNQELMITNVCFEEGGIGKLHHHPHRQVSFIKSGTFEVQIDWDKKYFTKETVLS